MAIATALILSGCASDQGPTSATIAGCREAVLTADSMISEIQAAGNGGDEATFHKDEIGRLAAKLKSLSLSIDDETLSTDINNFGDAYSEWIRLARAGDEAGANAAIDRTDGSQWYEYCNTLQ